MGGPKAVLFFGWLLLLCQKSCSLCRAHNRGDCLWHGVIHSSFFLILKLKNPGLTLLVFVLSKAAHKWYCRHPSAETHALYISARNHAKSILQLTINSFINRKCQNLSNSDSSRDFWHLTNNISNNFTSSFPPLLQPDGSTAVSSFSKAKPLAQTFGTNSILDDNGHIPPTPPSSDYFIPKIKIIHYDVFHALSGLNSPNAYGLDGVPSVVLKNWVFRTRSLPGQTLVCISLLLPILLAL